MVHTPAPSVSACSTPDVTPAGSVARLRRPAVVTPPATGTGDVAVRGRPRRSGPRPVLRQRRLDARRRTPTAPRAGMLGTARRVSRRRRTRRPRWPVASLDVVGPRPTRPIRPHPLTVPDAMLLRGAGTAGAMLVLSPGPRLDSLTLDVQILLPSQVPRRHPPSAPGIPAFCRRLLVLALCDAGFRFDRRTDRRGPDPSRSTCARVSVVVRRARRPGRGADHVRVRRPRPRAARVVRRGPAA